jgi:glutaredoxin
VYAEAEKMRLPLRAISICLFLLGIISSAFSQVYKWRDQDGNLIISMTPPPPGVQCEQQQIRGSSQPDAGTHARNSGKSAVEEVDLARSNRDIKVIMYVTDWCPYCKKATEYLNSLDVNLQTYDIEKDPEKNGEFLAKGNNGTGVPFIDVEGILMRGFSKKSIDAALEKRRHVVSDY